jgi:hypothetical protein
MIYSVLADYWASKGNYVIVAKLLVPALEGGTVPSSCERPPLLF